MKIQIVNTYEELSELSATTVLAQMVQDKRTNIAITSGASPEGMYTILSKWLKRYEELCKQTFYYNFDEVELSKTGKRMTESALEEQFYRPAGISEAHIYKLNSSNFSKYDEIIERNGGLDLMILGLGNDGHFCGNMPFAVDFDQYTYKLFVDKKFPWFSLLEKLVGEEKMPSYLFTMGFKSLLKVKQLVLIINGKEKAEAVKRFLNDDVSTEFPATVLRQHPNLTVILDKDAASLL